MDLAHSWVDLGTAQLQGDFFLRMFYKPLHAAGCHEAAELSQNSFIAWGTIVRSAEGTWGKGRTESL